MTNTLKGSIVALLVSGVAACGGDGGSSSGPEVEGGPVALRRLTADQYAQSIRSVLGDAILVPSRLEPDAREDGLLSVGTSFVSVTPSGFEKYETAARAIAEQALSPELREGLIGCQPASNNQADDACAREFIEVIGRRLFRRTLTEEDIAPRVALAGDSAETIGDFYEGLQTALSSLLLSPNFLFRVESIEPDSNQLTGTSIAPRLSYLLWNNTPDDELLDAAENGDLGTTSGLAAQVDRLLEAPQAEDGIRAFFSDLLEFRQIDDGLLRKDPSAFPAFTLTLASNAKEQTLRTIVDHLGTNDLDYRDLFTTRRTFLTPSLGAVYRVPISGEWQPFEFPENASPQTGPRAGLLSHVSLMSVHAHPARSSATLRGKFVREVLLCQTIPDPPPDVDFSVVENTDGEFRTARERLNVHVVDEGCASCHDRMDPIGLAFENFDAIGAYREQENGATIDASGDLDGETYEDSAGMGEALRDHPDLGACLVENVFRYAVGRDPETAEDELLDYLEGKFDGSGHRWSALMRTLALSEGFRTASGQRDAEEGGAQ